MNKLQNYIAGSWIEGDGEGKALPSAIDGAIVAHATTDGLDLEQMFDYGRKVGTHTLSQLTFQERGQLLKNLALHLLKKKEGLYEISYQTGATRTDSWIDIEGGFGNLFANASLRRNFPNQTYHVEGAPIDLSRGGSFMAHHIMVPKKGIAVHINAYNFPIWGMLEKCASNWMAGVAAVVKPATSTSFLTEALVKEIIASGILPEGAIQLLCGSARNLLDYVESQDVVTFTGSASTGRMLKAHSRIINEAVPFNMEADSLNCTVLGLDAVPGTPEFDLFIKEIRNEITTKCGQKCTAIRRIIVPQDLIEDVQIALGKALSKITIGDPRSEGVRMGALANKDQVNEVREQISKLSKTADIVYGRLGEVELKDADMEAGAFMGPIILLEKQPLKNKAVHEVEAFGPVSTLMPYSSIDEAIHLAQLGKGSLCSSIATYDDDLARTYTLGAASHHGRILILNRDNAKQSTGHGSALPTLVHGGPGRAGGGEEMGGMRGIKHYLQRCAVQGTPTTIAAVTGIYQIGAKVIQADKHPFTYHFEEIQPGMSLLTHKRTIIDSDIQNFANLSWDVFYAHTDITSLDGSIFEKRAAHGYFLLAAAAGLFVYPAKGPVGANYGLDECRFIRPVYHNDTIQVRLTCKEKVDRDSRGPEHPSGVVKWLVEILDEDMELVALATILTLVQMKSPFHAYNISYVKEKVAALSKNNKAAWGIMTSQHMVEHLEFFALLALEKIPCEILTPEDRIEKYKDSLWNYRDMPHGFDHPLLRKGEREDLRHPDLDHAKSALIESLQAVEDIFKENPIATVINPMFGYLNRYEWHLNCQKHVHHHFGQFGLL